jgi:hypothetical protein
MRRLWPVAAAAMLLIASTLAIPPVRAAITNVFTFVPGIGIVKDADGPIYAFSPGVGRIEEEGVVAEIEAAYYQNGELIVSIIGTGRYIGNPEYTLYAKGVAVGIEVGGGGISGGSAVTFEGRLRYKTEPPVSGDAYEVEIKGMSQRLTFTMEPCLDFDDLAKIGPTDTQNDISITTVSERYGDILKVWYYALNETSDEIIHYGYNIYENPDWYPEFVERYGMNHIVTDSGFVSRRTYTSYGFFSPRGNVFLQTFEMPAEDSGATLHLPFLTMIRHEKKKVSVDIPKGYEAIKCDIPFEFSLGTMRVTKVERIDDSNRGGATNKNMDSLVISYSLESKEPNMVFRGIHFTSSGYNSEYSKGIDETTGCENYIAVSVKKNATKYSFTVGDLEYFLLGEYVIPLDIG